MRLLSRPRLEDTTQLRQHCERRNLMLIEARQPVLDFWVEVAKELIPQRLPCLVDPREQGSRSGQQNAHIVDAVGYQALMTAASGLQQGAMPATSQWFHLTVRRLFSQEDETRGFLQEMETRMREVINQSNANHVLAEFKADLIAFGTAAAMFVEDDEDVFRIDPLSPGEYCIAEDARGRVDTCYRQFTMTVGQLAQEFGEDRLCASSRAAYDRQEVDLPVTCIHAIEPDRDRLNPESVRGQPWRSVYYELAADASEVLDVRGYERFPVLVCRWAKMRGTAYGHGRGMDALPHLVRLRKQVHRYGQALAFKAEPPLQIPSPLQAHEVRAMPGGRTVLTGERPVTTLFPVELDLRELHEDMEKTRQDIRDALGASLVSSLRTLTHQMTATEVSTRTTQDLMEFMPALYRLHEEMLSSFIELTWAAMDARGEIVDLPDELQDKTLDIEFTSPLARKARQEEIDAIVRTYAIAGEIAKVRADVLDNLNVDEAIRTIGEIEGAAVKVFYSLEEMRRERQAKAQAQIAEQAAQAAQQGVDIAQGVAKTQQLQSGAA